MELLFKKKTPTKLFSEAKKLETMALDSSELSVSSTDTEKPRRRAAKMANKKVNAMAKTLLNSRTTQKFFFEETSSFQVSNKLYI